MLFLFLKRLIGVVFIVDVKCGYWNVGFNKELSDFFSLLIKGVGFFFLNFVMILFLIILFYLFLMLFLRLIGMCCGG